MQNQPINRALLITFWLVMMLLVVFLCYRWVTQRSDGIVKTEISNTHKRIYLKLGADNYYKLVGLINGHKLQFLIDTGASRVALPRWFAEKANLPIVGAMDLNTANGETHAMVTEIKRLQLGPIKIEGISAVIMEEDLSYGLLGMNALTKFEFISKEGYLVISQSLDKEKR